MLLQQKHRKKRGALRQATAKSQSTKPKQRETVKRTFLFIPRDMIEEARLNTTRTKESTKGNNNVFSARLYPSRFLSLSLLFLWKLLNPFAGGLL